MKTAILKGKDIKNKKDFHKQIKNILNLPEYYGENLDALWDCLTGGVETPLTIIWEDFSYSKQTLGVYADKIMTLFKDTEKEIEGFKIESC